MMSIHLRPPFFFPLFSLGMAVGIFCFSQVSTASADPLYASNPPAVFRVNPQVLARSKAAFVSHDQSLKPAFEKLFQDASDALKIVPPSVMDKHQLPPSGDKHDYISQAPYFWQDTNNPTSGYVRRDGEHNPEAKSDSDSDSLKLVCSSVETLALAYYFSGEEYYADKASKLLRVWFLDPSTRMNPNLNYGQGISGKVEGRPQGLISAACLVDAIDAIGLLEGSNAWNTADQIGMKEWMSHYYEWLTTSKIGLGEAKAKNNHGTLYDTQSAVIALFLGKNDEGRNVLRDVPERRINVQIDTNGAQPLELSRTRSFHYSMKNLEGLMDLASIAQNQGIDLWHQTSLGGQGILKALEFIAPYWDKNKKWPYKQIDGFNFVELSEILQRAAPHYPESTFSKALKSTHNDLAANRNRILFETVEN